MHRKHLSKLTPLEQTLRKNMTKEERHIWFDFLKDHPIRFLRQKVINNYIVDFYCSKAKLVIEIDGSQHFNEESHIKDLVRTERIEEHDLLVLRFDNPTIHKNFIGVCEYIDTIVKERIKFLASQSDVPLKK